ncbi:TPA: YSIRK-type signal peptide-containing protein [Staphylococcus aureus]|nr:YSIRK-type signal peptide-containing protein [Staphylococcus aureus]HDJ7169602.1 YSIRK-type signal peptide-containing protein [Staphylococcus aureus Sa_TPS3185]HAY1166182.1 YSIRK-type signal peptide-containing protein [Staphylococcus aureus]HAY1739477.1 YSIRK-type signal peptide-containing protein [Staphylococcus aureus]HAY2618280.1 YSIRK-type signal peptide-containing protein [Staphylococcus aureus]HCD4155245.1 YSIRK-type signal peptide-containing protein [Staphylococcus aureus]
MRKKSGPINKRVDFLSNRLNKYSIRKFTIGTASILVGSTLIFGIGSGEAKADAKVYTNNENGTKSKHERSEVESAQEAKATENVQETNKVESAQEAKATENVQETNKVESAQEAKVTENVQETNKVVSAQEAKATESVQETNKVESSQQQDKGKSVEANEKSFYDLSKEIDQAVNKKEVVEKQVKKQFLSVLSEKK